MKLIVEITPVEVIAIVHELQGQLPHECIDLEKVMDCLTTQLQKNLQKLSV